MNIPPAVYELVDRFDRNITDYKRGKYNEAQVRREFIDPFFKAIAACRRSRFVEAERPS